MFGKTFCSARQLSHNFSAVSSTFFDVMGAVPAIGRSFRSDDDVPGAPPVVVISDGLWATYFNRDPAASASLGRAGIQ